MLTSVPLSLSILTMSSQSLQRPQVEESDLCSLFALLQLLSQEKFLPPPSGQTSQPRRELLIMYVKGADLLVEIWFSASSASLRLGGNMILSLFLAWYFGYKKGIRSAV